MCDGFSVDEMTIRGEEWVIQYDDAGQRLDRWLRKSFQHLPQSRIEKLCRTGQIRINEERAKPSARVQEGQRVTLPITITVKPPAQSPRSRKIPDWLRGDPLFEDDYIIALNKPSGVAVQGGTGQSSSLDQLASIRFPTSHGPPRLVHRLDKETSGLLLLARTRRVAAQLAKEFRGRRISKLYLALVHGCPRPSKGQIKTNERGALADSLALHFRGKQAHTEFAVIDNVGEHLALMALKPITGRTHQLRIHMSGIGHPIVGDRRYGSTKMTGGIVPNRLMLHAKSLNFVHPHYGISQTIDAPLPQLMSEMFKQLGWPEEGHKCDHWVG